MTVVTAALEAPYPERPNEGPIRFNVEFSPMASPSFEPGRPGETAVEVARLIERGLRQSGAIDQEALCVMAGRKVGEGGGWRGSWRGGRWARMGGGGRKVG